MKKLLLGLLVLLVLSLAYAKTVETSEIRVSSDDLTRCFPGRFCESIINITYLDTSPPRATISSGLLSSAFAPSAHLLGSVEFHNLTSYSIDAYNRTIYTWAINTTTTIRISTNDSTLLRMRYNITAASRVDWNFSIGGSFGVVLDPVAMSGCSSISTSDTYTLTANITGNKTGASCLDLSASNSVLDCDGFSIMGNESPVDTVGIFIYSPSNLSNVTIRDCRVQNYGTGVFFDSMASNIRLENSTVFNNTLGIRLRDSSNSILSSNAVSNSSTEGFYIVRSNSTTLTDNFATGNAFSGFHIESGFNNTFERNNASRNYRGFLISDNSSNSRLTSNAAYNNTFSGISIDSSSDSNLSANRIFNNSEIGIYIADSVRTSLLRDHFYRNGMDLQVNNTGGSAVPVNLSSVSFDSPAGNFVNYTNLSINDSVSAGSAYSINWSASPAPLPTGYISFAQKFVNITPLAGTVSIDTAIFHWDDNEVSNGGYIEARFDLYKFNSSGWTDLNASLHSTLNTLSLSDLSSFSVFGILQLNSSSSACTTISTSGSTALTSNGTGADQSASPLSGNACIKIAVSHVAFSCAGYTLTGNGTESIGILLNGSLTNVTIRDCPAISNYSYGIYLYQSNSSTVLNTTLFSNSYGIYLGSSSFSNLSSNTLENHSTYGFILDSSSGNNLTLNTIRNNTRGIYLISSSNNTLVSNTLDQNSQFGFYIVSGSNDNVFLSNNISNGAYGFYFTSNRNNSLSSNRVFGASATAFHLQNASAILSGNHGAFGTGSGSLDLYANASIVSMVNPANFTTDHLTIGFSELENLSLHTAFIDGTGVEEARCGSSLQSLCPRVSELLYLVPLGNGRMGSLLIFYNSTKIPGSMGESNIQLGQWGDAGWSAAGVSALDLQADFVGFGPLTGFGYYSAVGFLPVFTTHSEEAPPSPRTPRAVAPVRLPRSSPLPPPASERTLAPPPTSLLELAPGEESETVPEAPSSLPESESIPTPTPAPTPAVAPASIQLPTSAPSPAAVPSPAPAGGPDPGLIVGIIVATIAVAGAFYFFVLMK